MHVHRVCVVQGALLQVARNCQGAQSPALMLFVLEQDEHGRQHANSKKLGGC